MTDRKDEIIKEIEELENKYKSDSNEDYIEQIQILEDELYLIVNH